MNVAAKFSAWYRASRPAGAGHRRGARATPDLTLASMNDLAARPDTYSRFQIDGLTVAYRQRPVLWNVNFKAKNAGMTAIVGANGAGKSTLLKAAMGIVPCLSGKISIDGAPLAASRHKLAYIPQRASIDWEFPVTALDIACMGRYRKIGWFRPPALADRDHARQCLDLVGMGGFADRQIGQLSGGQQQRVMMARALAQDAQIFLLDEPLAGIDAASEETIIALLKDLARQGRTIIAVHHELSTVSEYFDEVLLLNGHVIAHGPVETCFIPENIAETFNSNGYGKTSGKRLRAS